MSERVLWSELAGFFDKQKEATRVADAHSFTLYGGSRGPGKSYWLRWYLLRYLMRAPQVYGKDNVRVGLFAEDYPTLRDRQISKIAVEFPQWLGKLADTQTDGFGFKLHGEYGGGFLALRNLDDPSKYVGTEFAVIGVEELNKHQVKMFNVLRGSRRWPGIPDPKFVANANPGDIGHLWVKSYWIDKLFPPELQGRANEFAFVPALPDDNPYLEPSYWDWLNTLPKDLAEAWRWGNWNVFQGQVFNIREGHHTCDPFTIHEHWPRWRAVDWGSVNPWVCLWLAKDPDTGRIYVYREAYETGLTDRRQARKVKELTAEKVSYTLADPSMWTKKTHEDKTFSTADEYAAEGVMLTRADNDRMTGKRKVATLLEDLPDGKPGLVIFNTCVNGLRTLPALPHDPVNVEDVNTDADDHWYDALRYGLTRVNPRPRPPLPAPLPKLDPVMKRAGYSMAEGRGWSKDW